MHKPQFRNTDFWIRLRKQTSVDGVVGVEECSYWCQDALKLLEKYGSHGFKKVEGTVSDRSRVRYDLFVNGHWFLVRRYDDGLFIADGTAGQVQDEFPLGYYGLLQQVPLPLNLFYRSGIKRNGLG